MVDGKTLRNILMGLGFAEPNINTAMPALLGEVSQGNNGKLLDMSEARSYLGGVSRWTVQRAVDSGKLPSVRIGTRVMFDLADLASFISSHKVKARKKTCRFS